MKKVKKIKTRNFVEHAIVTGEHGAKRRTIIHKSKKHYSRKNIKTWT